jgi:hypothetical protein
MILQNVQDSEQPQVHRRITCRSTKLPVKAVLKERSRAEKRWHGESSASKRADGIAIRGKTKGRMV